MIAITVTGDTEEKLLAIQQRLGNFSPAMSAVGKWHTSRTVQGFATEGRDGKWAPLAERTRVYKSKKGKTKILTFNSLLQKSIVSRSAAASVEEGTSSIYGAIHQFGGAAGRGHKSILPARPYLVVTSGDGIVIKKIIDDYIAGRM